MQEDESFKGYDGPVPPQCSDDAPRRNAPSQQCITDPIRIFTRWNKWGWGRRIFLSEGSLSARSDDTETPRIAGNKLPKSQSDRNLAEDGSTGLPTNPAETQECSVGIQLLAGGCGALHLGMSRETRLSVIKGRPPVTFKVASLRTSPDIRNR